MLQRLLRKARNVRRRFETPEVVFRLLSASRPSFTCPICGYVGPFRDKPGAVHKINSRCPQCRSTERTRAEWVALEPLLSAEQRVIHFAPEALLSPLIRKRVASYETADLSGAAVDHQADLRALPFESASYDLVIASHVLEHIKEDGQALAEIRRILRPGGVAVLPVPTHPGATVEYDAPKPEESGHVRRPGLDYYDRYADHFARVTVLHCDDFPEQYHLYSETRGGRTGHTTVPVCYA